MKRKITSFMLLLAMLVSIVAVLPVASFAEDTTFKGTDVTLTDGILLNFYVEADDALGIDNAEKDGNYYVLTVDVPAKKMGNDIVAEFKAGADVVGVHSYSVKQYAEGILAGNYDAETKALVTAMLNYGAAAQKYFNYNADELVGTPVTDTAALKAAKAPEVEVDDEAKIFVGASLILEGTMTLRFYFAGSVDSATVDGEDAIVNADSAEYCYVDVKVTPDNIDKAYTVVAGDTTVTYSVLNYLQRNADNAALSEMVASIYAYGVAAENYVESHDYEIKVVTSTRDNGDSVIKDSVQIADVIGDKHFYPTTEDPDGNDLYVEFSMLFNESMSNFKGSNITFPGIYGAESLASDKGAPAFWYYIKTADGITAGKYDDWTSNAVDKNDPDKYFSNMANPVEFDGWHRFGVKFHQNTDVDIANNKISYTVTVTMYIDGVRVYEAELDAMNTKKTNSHYLRLYEAQIVDGEVVYTDNIEKFASYYRYTAYVADANNPAYFVTADKYITVGDSFVLDVERVDDPADATLEVEKGVFLDAKYYYEEKGVCAHEGVEYNTVIKNATIFSEGEKSGVCVACGDTVTAVIEKLEPDIKVVTGTSDNGDESVIKDSVQIAEVIGDKHFYPTTEDPDGNDLYVEFSMLFNESMSNFNGSNITFPGIYGAKSLASNSGAPAFWYYIKTADGITAGKYDDWTSNAVNKNDPDKYFSSMAKPVEFDGWHRFGVKFHQNTDVDIANNKISYTVTVTMYIDGVRVYEAELDAMNTKKTNSHYLRLYEAQIVDGEVVYTDNIEKIASYYRYTAYVADANNPAYFVTADKYITVGDSFVLDVERVDNPESATLEVEDGVELSAKAYYSVK